MRIRIVYARLCERKRSNPAAFKVTGLLRLRLATTLLFIFLSNPALGWVLNNPYPAKDADKKIYYASFNEQPKTLDPARAYSNNEYLFMSNIYEPPLQYDYLARPYKLMPLTATEMPTVRYLNNQALSVYTIHLKKGIFYQPHPAFAKGNELLDLLGISELSDFRQSGTRELVADDYIYQIKRLATPSVHSPIYGLMSEHILGFSKFSQQFPARRQRGEFLDLRRFPLEGVRKVDNYTFEVTLIGIYPQFRFWLAMPFFSPMPWEADRFYAKKGMDDKNLSLDWYPIGTGPFMLSENNPNRRMVLDRNPNYRPLYFAGHLIPRIEKAVYTLEKESIPRWNKFLQGYYDISEISGESFDQVIELSPSGKPVLSPSMQAKHMQLQENMDLNFTYVGFNMLDPVVGGMSERPRKLRQAISIAINFDEYINIFYNGRGKAAQGPLPPGIFGFKEGQAGINPYVNQWVNGKRQRRPIAVARLLMREAGYPKGHDPSTHAALVLHYDVSATGAPDEKAKLDWMRKQFAKLGIELDVRATLYNRFQEKLRQGNSQVFTWSWIGDYPDPENFLFLLYSINGKVLHGGENHTNYANRLYDSLFDQMKNRPNDAERQRLIDAMVEIVRRDAPMVWGINTQSLQLSQPWVSKVKPNPMFMSILKYIDIDVPLRNKLREAWNRPLLWPIGLLVLFLLLCCIPLYRAYRRKETAKARRLGS